MNLNVGLLLACVASVFVQFRSKEHRTRVGLSLPRNQTETFATQASLVFVVIAMINLTEMSMTVTKNNSAYKEPEDNPRFNNES